MNRFEILKEIENRKRRIYNFETKICQLKNELKELKEQLGKNKYEVTLVFKASTLEYEINSIKDKIKEIVEIQETKSLGMKELPYEIQRNTIGFYYQIFIKTNNINNEIAEVEKIFREEDKILRFLTIRLED